MASTDVRRPTRHRRQGSQAGARKDSAEIAGLLRLCILERRQIRAAMRTKYRGNAHWLGAKWAVPHAASRHNHSHRLPRPKYIKTGHRSEGSDDNHWSDHHCVCPVIVTVDHPVTSLDRAALPILFVHARDPRNPLTFRFGSFGGGLRAYEFTALVNHLILAAHREAYRGAPRQA